MKNNEKKYEFINSKINEIKNENYKNMYEKKLKEDIKKEIENKVERFSWLNSQIEANLKNYMTIEVNQHKHEIEDLKAPQLKKVIDDTTKI